MLKVTKLNQNENGERVFLMKDTEAPQQKISLCNGVVTIEAKGEKTKTLKTPRSAKKYIEVVNCYIARKGLEAEAVGATEGTNQAEAVKVDQEKKDVVLNATDATTGEENNGQAVTPIDTTKATTEAEKHQENETIKEVDHVDAVEASQEKKDGDTVEAQHVEILESMENITVNKADAVEDQAEAVDGLNIQDILKEKERKYLLDVITNQKEEEYKNLNFHVSNIDIAINDNCQAIKIQDANGGQRYTNFYLSIASDSQELNTKLRNLMQILMDNYMDFLKQENFASGKDFFKNDIAKFNTYNGIILKNGANIQIPYFMEESLKQHEAYGIEHQEITLRIPYQNNVGEIRKYVHIVYFLAKKFVRNFYSAMKKMKQAQEKEANKKAQ